MQTTVFTPLQIHLLQMFQYMNSEEELIELKNLLFHYYSQKIALFKVFRKEVLIAPYGILSFVGKTLFLQLKLSI